MSNKVGPDRIFRKYEKALGGKEVNVRQIRERAAEYAQTGKISGPEPRNRREAVERQMAVGMGEKMRRGR